MDIRARHPEIIESLEGPRDNGKSLYIHEQLIAVLTHALAFACCGDDHIEFSLHRSFTS